MGWSSGRRQRSWTRRTSRSLETSPSASRYRARHDEHSLARHHVHTGSRLLYLRAQRRQWPLSMLVLTMPPLLPLTGGGGARAAENEAAGDGGQDRCSGPGCGGGPGGTTQTHGDVRHRQQEEAGGGSSLSLKSLTCCARSRRPLPWHGTLTALLQVVAVLSQGKPLPFTLVNKALDLPEYQVSDKVG